VPKAEKQQEGLPYPPGSEMAFQWMPAALVHEAISNGNHSLSKFLKNKPLVQPKSLNKSTSGDRNPRFSSSLERFWRTIMMDISRYPMRRITNDDIEELAPKFMEWISTPLDNGRDIDIDFFVQGFMAEWYKWNFAVAEDGTYCMVPTYTEVGDCITVLRGAKVPIVLRPIRPKDELAPSDFETRFLFVGPCYAHEFMDGQAFRNEEGNGSQKREFKIM
jgi:hypothetical protein